LKPNLLQDTLQPHLVSLFQAPPFPALLVGRGVITQATLAATTLAATTLVATPAGATLVTTLGATLVTTLGATPVITPATTTPAKRNQKVKLKKKFDIFNIKQ
jgi:hypothetical protein